MINKIGMVGTYIGIYMRQDKNTGNMLFGDMF